MVTLWALNFVIVKVALREFPPLLLAGLRIALAGVFISPAYFWQRSRTRETWSREDLPVLLFLGMFGVSLNQLFFVLGMSRTSVAHSSIVMAMMPLCVLLMAALMRQERITPRKATGMLVAMSGVALLNLLPGAQPAAKPGVGASPLGDLFIFLSGFAFALFTVAGKQISGRHSSITVNTFAYVGGALALAPITWWQSRGFEFGEVTWRGWASLIYMALFPSVICYLIFYYALRHIAASRVSAFSYVQPVLAMTLATITLGERITRPLVAGAVVIFSGVYLAERG